MRFHRRRLTLILFALTAMFAMNIALTAPPTTQPPTSRPLFWAARDINLSLHNLPRSYFCDELRQKFRDVLLAVGARAEPNVLASRCEAGSRSPSVRSRFSIPELVANGVQNGTVGETATALVRLEPGHPVSLDATDCELMRQIKDGLLAPLSQHVVTFNLACSAPPARGPRFSLTARTLQPLVTNARVADERELARNRRN